MNNYWVRFLFFTLTLLLFSTGVSFNSQASGLAHAYAAKRTHSFLKRQINAEDNSKTQSAAQKTFSFHLAKEPSSLKPWEQQSANSNYFFSLVNSTLLKYQDHKLNPALAEKCLWVTEKKIRCQLRPQLLWSDGETALTSDDFVRAFRAFVNPKNANNKSTFLFSVKNAKKIFMGEMPVEKLGVRAINKVILEIDLETVDHDFLYTLSHPLLSPIPPTSIYSLEEIRKKPSLHLSSGPYKISSWINANKIHLESNNRYWQEHGKRPSLDVWILSEDTVALQLYEKKELSMLRRLPTVFFDKYRGRNDFFEIPQFRFDYIGFSPKLQKNIELKQALSQSLDFAQLQKIFSAKGLPGCPGFIAPNSPGAPSPLGGNNSQCVEFSLALAQKKWAEYIKTNPNPNLNLIFSRLGGDDHQNGLEWMQSQWKTNLSTTVTVTGIENQIFLEKIKKGEMDLFRKGINLDRPTCLAALENFIYHAPENYIGFNDKDYDTLIFQLRNSISAEKKKTLCQRALSKLIQSNSIIPTGPIHFTMLVQPQWKNWKLNELNQLDLSLLEWKP